MKNSFFFDESEISKTKPKPRKSKKQGCEACGLYTSCISPKMLPAGLGKRKIVIIGDKPSTIDDEQNLPFADRGGDWLLDCFEKQGIDLENDCTVLNVLCCTTPEQRSPTADELKHCRSRWVKQVKELKPDLIFAFGTPAISAVLSDSPKSLTATNMHGRIVPSVEWGCWVACGFHPTFYSMDDFKFGGRMKEVIEAGLKKLDEPFEDQRLDESKYEIIEDITGALAILHTLAAETQTVAFDYEATSLDPWAEKFKPLLISFACDGWEPFAIPLDHPHARWTKEELKQIYQAIKEWLASDCPKVAQNWAYEELVSRVFFGTPVNNVIACTQVTEHVLDNRKGITGQMFMEYTKYCSTHKTAVNTARLDREFLDTVARYGVLDSRYCLKIHNDQQVLMTDDLRRAYALFHEAIPQFVLMKVRGIPVDQDILHGLAKENKDSILALESVKNGRLARQFKKKYGKAFDSGSPQSKQLMFFGLMGLEPVKLTDSGKNMSNPKHCSTDKETLQNLLTQVDEDSEEALIINSCLELSSLIKLRGYIDNFIKLSKRDGYIHPSFNLSFVRTYRSSSSDPNFQNIPVRIPSMARLRTCLVSRYDGLLELDFAGAEVRGIALVSKDKNLIADIKDEIDFHKYFASLLYELPEDDITKEQRYKGKNGFVFPEFYGSYHKTIARLYPEWNEDTVRKTENALWNRYKDVKLWQEHTQREYERSGSVKFLTGFRTQFGKLGLMSRNNCVNDPIQGFAFHRLLRVLLDLEYEMRRREMKSIIFGQIHDSVVIDYVQEELEEIIDMSREIVRRPAWDFDTLVPWEAEIKVGKNMLEMEEIIE